MFWPSPSSSWKAGTKIPWSRLLFYYYGTKKALVKHYPSPIGFRIIEPFGGAAAYSVHHLMRDVRFSAVVYEKDPRVVALWTRLLGMSPEEIRAIPCPGVGDKTSDYFVMVAATGNAINKSRRMTVTPRMPRIVEIMKRQVADKVLRLSGRIEVINADYREAFPTAKTDTVFIDPPYSPNNRPAEGSLHGGGKGYAKGCCSGDLDYQEIAEFARNAEGGVIACDYHDATWLPFGRLKRVTDSQKKSYAEGVWLKNIGGLSGPIFDLFGPSSTGPLEL